MFPRFSIQPKRPKRFLAYFCALALTVLITLGVFAKNGWLPSTDSLTGKKTGWFGAQLPRNASSSWNPVAPPLPEPSTQLSKEYIKAGSRLLAVEDANANAAPPADLAVWRPSTGVWWVMGPGGTQQATETWGTNGDKPVPGDYDGDGKTDFSVFRPGNNVWYVINSSSGTIDQLPFGASGDIPAVADFDGDGKTNAAVFRPNVSSGLGTWYIHNSVTGQATVLQFGLHDDKPAPADYDGDGRADIGVWRGSTQTFYSLNSSNTQFQAAVVGDSGGVVVSADYDGDGKADYAIRNGSIWNIRKSSSGTIEPYVPLGDVAGDTPVQNDYDGDGKVDVAVFRGAESSPGAGDAGNWYIRQSASSLSLRQVHWGAANDVPVPAFYRR